MNEIKQKYERMSQISHKGQRLYNDEYIIRVLAMRIGVSIDKIKSVINAEILNHQPTEPKHKTIKQKAQEQQKANRK